MTDTKWQNRIVGEDTVAAADLTPHPQNFRKHPKAQRAAMEGALDSIGWIQRVIVNRTTGNIIDGHLRVEEAAARGESVPVVYVELDEDEERAALLTFDPLGALATPNRDILDELLAEQRSLDLDGLGATLDGLYGVAPGDGLTDPDDVPEAPKVPKTKPGDLWVLGDHKLLCGDATSAEDVARLLDGNEPNLMVTDPPYGIGLDQGWRDRVGINRLGAAQSDRMEGDTTANWLAAWEQSPSVVAYVWHAGLKANEVASDLHLAGYELRGQIVWVKPVHVLSRGHYHGKHEPCWYAVRGNATAGWIGDRSQLTVWEAASPKQIMSGSDETKEDHPTQKPVECMARPIRNHEGDVYDPFVGSGTTIIAAEQLGRRCYAMEIDPVYCDVARIRWEEFTGRKAERVD